MFRFFRFLLILLSLAAALLTIFAITGSYDNKSYLTKTYLLNVHLDSLKLSKLIDSSNFDKRDLQENLNNFNGFINNLNDYSEEDILEISTNLKTSKTKRDWASQIISATGNEASDLADAAESTLSSLTNSGSSSDSASALIDEFTSLSYSELGLADVYQISFWGYCRGAVNGSSKKDFDNSNVNITWCTKPKVGYKFDPVQLFKNELNNTLENGIDGVQVSSSLSQVISYFVDNLKIDDLDLPGNLNKDLTLFGNISVASFGLLLAGAVLAVISIIIQLLGCFISPDSCCLSFLNFLFECLIFVVLLVGSILVTYTMSYTRNKINDNTDDYGIKAFLSINFYAFVWSGAVAALLCCFFNLLGHCCGLFSTGRRKFRSAVHEEFEPEMVYSHHDSMSEVGSYKTGGHSHH